MSVDLALATLLREIIREENLIRHEPLRAHVSSDGSLNDDKEGDESAHEMCNADAWRFDRDSASGLPPCAECACPLARDMREAGRGDE